MNQNDVTVVILRNGVKWEVKEDHYEVENRIDMARFDDGLYEQWIELGCNPEYTGPRQKAVVTLTNRKNGSGITLYPDEVKEVTTKEVVDDQEMQFPTSETGSTRVTLVDGRELEVEEDFGTVNVRWNAALRGENGKQVLSLTEKDTGWWLSVLAQNIELVEEMR